MAISLEGRKEYEMGKSFFRSSRFLLGVLVVLIAAAVIIWIQCSEQYQTPTAQEEINESYQLSKANPQIQEVMRVQDRHTQDLLSIPGVVGLGTGLSNKGKGLIRVYTIGSDVTGIPKNVEGVPVEEGRFGADELRGADEAFITSTTRDVLPVGELDGERLANVPGPVTRKLSDRFAAM